MKASACTMRTCVCVCVCARARSFADPPLPLPYLCWHMSNRACLMHRLTLALPLAVQPRVNVSESMSVCVTSEARVHAAAGAARKRQTQSISHNLALQTLYTQTLTYQHQQIPQVHAPERTRVCTHAFITTERDEQDKDTREMVCAGGERRVMMVPAPSPFPPHSPLPPSLMPLSAAFLTGWQNVLPSRCTSAGRMEHINIALANHMHAHTRHTHTKHLEQGLPSIAGWGR